MHLDLGIIDKRQSMVIWTVLRAWVSVLIPWIITDFEKFSQESGFSFSINTESTSGITTFLLVVTYVMVLIHLCIEAYRESKRTYRDLMEDELSIYRMRINREIASRKFNYEEACNSLTHGDVDGLTAYKQEADLNATLKECIGIAVTILAIICMLFAFINSRNMQEAACSFGILYTLAYCLKYGVQIYTDKKIGITQIGDGDTLDTSRYMVNVNIRAEQLKILDYEYRSFKQ